MAAIPLYLHCPFLCYPSLLHSHLDELMLPLLFFAFSVLFFSLLLLFSLYSKLKNTAEEQTQNPNETALSIINRALPKIKDKTQEPHKTHVSNLTHSTHSLLLEILSSNSPKRGEIPFNGDLGKKPSSRLEGESGDFDGEECGKSGDDEGGKKKKKRAKKKRLSSRVQGGAVEGSGDLVMKEKQELVCLYPFTSSSSATQRKIKQQYDQLMKCNQSKGLTVAQVYEFANCLIEARNDLVHKSGVIKRKFTIAKALLSKADRSSFDRLRQQIYKLELEQKRLEEDTFVYNWLQQQLKLSPAYKKMLEIGTCKELNAKSGNPVEDTDPDFDDISFEEFLAQEKKDSFWQRNGKLRSCAT